MRNTEIWWKLVISWKFRGNFRKFALELNFVCRDISDLTLMYHEPKKKVEKHCSLWSALCQNLFLKRYCVYGNKKFFMFFLHFNLYQFFFFLTHQTSKSSGNFLYIHFEIFHNSFLFAFLIPSISLTPFFIRKVTKNRLKRENHLLPFSFWHVGLSTKTWVKETLERRRMNGHNCVVFDMDN